MSKTPRSINGVQTRVVKTKEGFFSPQFSTDGMTWFPLSAEKWNNLDKADAVLNCELFECRANCLPDLGEVVWRSGK